MTLNRLVLLTLVICMALVSVAPAALAQDDVFGGGGPAIGMWELDFSGLNETLESAGQAARFESPVVMISGGGGATVSGFSVGGFGGGNTLTSENAELSLGFGGAELMRTASHWGGVWSYGALLGGGNAELTIIHDKTADDVKGEVTDPTVSTLDTNFFIAGPQMSFRTELTPFAHFKATAGYLFAVGGAWESADGRTLSGGDVDWSGPYVQFGIAFGGGSSSLPSEPTTDIN